MNKRKNEISQLNSKYNLTISENNLKPKKTRFEILYENSSIHDKKLDLIRAKIYFNQQERMIPDITQKSKNINRKRELFYKRLYQSDNEISTEVNKIKHKNKEKNNLKLSREIKSNKINKETEKNNSISEKSLKDEENLYIINNKEKNEKHKKFYKSSKIKSRNSSFIFQPIINNNSRYLASKMKTNSIQRLFSLSLREKENLKIISQTRQEKLELLLKSEKEKKLFKINNRYKPNVKMNKKKLVDKLYEKGINSIKRKEEKTKKERLLNEKEYLQYSFTPKINHNYSFNCFNKSNDVSFDQSNKNNQKRLYNNLSFNRDNKILHINNSSFYERNKTWKKLVDKKKEALRKKLNNDNSFNCEENRINKKSDDEILKTDEDFIKKHFIEYQTFLNKYTQQIRRKNLDKINYRKKNIPPKKVYAKKLVIEYVNECDSNCPTNDGTVKFYCDKRPINNINKNRDELKISDFFKDDIKLETKNFNNEQEYFVNSKKSQNNRNNIFLPKHTKNYTSNLSFYNAVNNLVNKIE